MVDNETVECWWCPHDVDEHDVRARCLDPACACGWEEPSAGHGHRRARLPGPR